MKSYEVKVQDVDSGSIAEEAGIEKGDCILSINNEKICDIFDYRFLTASENLTVEIQKADGEVWEIEIEKDEYEDLGLEFENSMIDEARSCTNKCIFCFIDQLPGGMRDTLYFKDDDSRLSFLTGNYVTLTNMDNNALERIIKYRMSPINISVHTTNPDLRVYMLNNKFAGDILNKLKRLTESGITINCQIVLCRYINDGAELDRTISDLSALYPYVNSISVVPVGLTRHRKGLIDLKPFDKEASLQIISQIDSWQGKLFKEHGSRVVYLADEFYIMAGAEIPGYENYEDFPQIENGVGLISLLRHEFEETLESQAQRCLIENSRIASIATGVSSYEYIKGMAETLENRYNNLKVNVYQIKNSFFGENVTVTGLLTGGDIAAQLKGKELGDELLLCRCMLKAGEELFLDDYTVSGLTKELGVRINIVENNGNDFVLKVLGEQK